MGREPRSPRKSSPKTPSPSKLLQRRPPPAPGSPPKSHPPKPPQRRPPPPPIQLSPSQSSIVSALVPGPLDIRKQRSMEFDLRQYAQADPSEPYNPDEWEDELVHSDDENIDDNGYRGISNDMSQIIITQDNIANDAARKEEDEQKGRARREYLGQLENISPPDSPGSLRATPLLSPGPKPELAEHLRDELYNDYLKKDP